MRCGYHSDDEYSFCLGSGEQYDLPRHEYTAGYTTAITNEDISKRSKNALTLKYQERDYFIMGGYDVDLVEQLHIY
ncbi:hypothetical protein C2G38_2222082 [Gigaspora rosea]|uniref:Uncharacterized protein n=1 Tax=Gigaspora rosea TaxID=44941 RepID=A0A397U2R7_9GLOM|nr:hypothetical protein C2G38_2222082 [Gigaspora rosea]